MVKLALATNCNVVYKIYVPCTLYLYLYTTGFYTEKIHIFVLPLCIPNIYIYKHTNDPICLSMRCSLCTEYNVVTLLKSVSMFPWPVSTQVMHLPPFRYVVSYAATKSKLPHEWIGLSSLRPPVGQSEKRFDLAQRLRMNS